MAYANDGWTKHARSKIADEISLQLKNKLESDATPGAYIEGVESFVNVSCIGLRTIQNSLETSTGWFPELG